MLVQKNLKTTSLQAVFSIIDQIYSKKRVKVGLKKPRLSANNFSKSKKKKNYNFSTQGLNQFKIIMNLKRLMRL